MMDYRLRWIRKIVKVSVVLLFVTIHKGSAQQVAHFGIWRESIQFLNPSMAGLDRNTKFLLDYRSQWLGLEGSPNTSTVLLQSWIPAFQGGMGLYFQNDRLGNRRFDSYGLQLSKHVMSGEKYLWSIGVDIVYQRFGVNSSDVILPGRANPDDDPSLLPWFDGGDKILLGAGSVLKMGSWLLGVSGRQITELSSRNSNSYVTDNEVFLNLSYSWTLNNFIEIIPFSNFYSNFSVFQSFLALESIVNEQLMGSVGIRLDNSQIESLGVMLGYRFKNNFMLKYQYELGLNSLSSRFNGSHEILFSYDIDFMIGREIRRPAIYSPRAL